MEDLDNERCHNCRWWDIQTPAGKALVFGECHRYPPVFRGAQFDEIEQFAFPLTEEDDFCGEFVNRKSSGASSRPAGKP